MLCHILMSAAGWFGSITTWASVQSPWPSMDQNDWAVEPTKKQPLEWACSSFSRLLKWCSKTFWQNLLFTALLYMCCLGFSLILGNWPVWPPKHKHGWSLGQWIESKTSIIFNQMPSPICQATFPDPMPVFFQQPLVQNKGLSNRCDDCYQHAEVISAVNCGKLTRGI